jgi:hypothetical protein
MFGSELTLQVGPPMAIATGTWPPFWLNTYVRHKDDLRSMGDDVCVEFKGGVARLYIQGREMISVPELREFGADYSKLNDYVAHGPVRTFSHSRLEVLFHAFR